MAFKMKYNKGKGFPFKKTEEEEENPITTKTGSPDVVPTSRDTIQSYIHSQIPESLKGRVEKKNQQLNQQLKLEKSSKTLRLVNFQVQDKEKKEKLEEKKEELEEK